jgi:uncharacterized membrane-anchored protein
MREHPARRQVVGEMHLRRWPAVCVPGVILQWLRLASEDDKAAQRDILLGLPQSDRFEQTAGQRHIAGALSDTVRFVWEAHSEASSLTLFAAADGGLSLDRLTARADFSAAVAMGERLPGDIIRASRIWIAADDNSVDHSGLINALVADELVSCHVGAGARLWSDFRIGPEGYGRMVIAANGLPPGDLTRLLQRLQELGNYRNLALLGLPTAQGHWPRLNAAEEELRRIGQDQIRADMRDDDLMARASALSLELTSLATDASFRMSATAAYAKLVEDRLGELAVAPIEGYPSLVDFTQRRFLPAVRTCAAFTRREGQLSLRAAQLTSLLRARIETRIENQNARLLASMERSAALQLRLQQLVEGLSVVALSYYSLALLEKLLIGAQEIEPAIHAHLIVAVLTLPVAGAVWLGLKRMKKRILH